MANLKINDLNKNFGSTEVLKGINLDINDGDFLVLLGPSGCGKSTLLNTIAGLEISNSGDILIDDYRVNDMEPSDRDIALVFQSYALYPAMTVKGNVTFGLEQRKTPKDEIESSLNRVSSLLKINELLDRKPSQLSGGQRQRVAMGRAIVRRPDAFLFDEPLSNLDAKLRTQMRTEIKKLHQTLKTTIIYVTHDQVEAMTLADRIIIMRDGYIEQIGSPIEVFTKPVNIFVATFIGSPPMNIIEGDIIKNDNKSLIKIDNDISLECPQNLIHSLENRKKIYLGIRAEDIVPKENDMLNNKNLNFKKSINLAEPLGTETQLFFTIKNIEIISRMYNPRSVNVGDEINFEVDHSKVHFFDIDSKKAII